MGYQIYTGADVPEPLFPDHTDYSVDGTEAPTPEAGEQISRFQYCDICSTPLTGNWKPYKLHGRTVCRLCLDEDNPPRPTIDYQVHWYDEMPEDTSGLAVDNEGNYAVDRDGHWVKERG
jgi:hypothetical protein